MKPSRTSVLSMALWLLLSLLQSVLALVLGFMAVGQVNMVGAPVIDAVLPGSMGADGLPLTAPAQVLFLAVLFLAGMAGAFMVVLIAPRAAMMHAVVFGVLAIVGDLFIVVNLAGTLPLWLLALSVLTVPPQIWLGAVLGLRARRRWVPWARAEAEAGAAPVPSSSR
jgi:hypothetical protein